jgi:hypothetical protein
MGGAPDVDLPDLGPLTMEEPILNADLSLGSLPSYDCQVNMTLKFDDLNIDDRAREVMEEVPVENVPSETSLAA